mmetsp:Transcript_32288/g.86452  ORF Transcript_32288/g.86452 Transcript_32288/m.86452 type:complete len:219 (-) Transcript_32288:794-1450(-)
MCFVRFSSSCMSGNSSDGSSTRRDMAVEMCKSAPSNGGCLSSKLTNLPRMSRSREAASLMKARALLSSSPRTTPRNPTAGCSASFDARSFSDTMSRTSWRKPSKWSSEAEARTCCAGEATSCFLAASSLVSLSSSCDRTRALCSSNSWRCISIITRLAAKTASDWFRSDSLRRRPNSESRAWSAALAAFNSATSESNPLDRSSALSCSLSNSSEERDR